MVNFSKLSWALVAVTLGLTALVMIFSILEHFMLILILTGVILIITFILLLVTVGTKADAKLEYDGMIVRGPMLHVKIPYGDISSVEMREEMDFGWRIGGYAGVSRLGGKFRNKEFGNYDISVNIYVKKYIIVRRRNGKTLVFNHKTAEETVLFYEKLKKWVGK